MNPHLEQPHKDRLAAAELVENEMTIRQVQAGVKQPFGRFDPLDLTSVAAAASFR